MHIQNPWFLIILPLAIAAAVFGKVREKRPSIYFSSEMLFTGIRSTLKTQLSEGMVLFRIAAFILIVIALARPQFMIEESVIETEGIDIVLAVDTSTSMLAEDFTLNGNRTNRLAAVKDVMEDFINNRQSDRIGIVAFASRGYSVAPLTLDYGWLIQNMERVNIGMIEDGTAIGSGLGSALNRLKDTEAKSKVVILLTDGRNNAGRISPLTAAEAARALNIKVYTIGAGTEGLAPYPARDLFGNTVYRRVKIEIDEETLKRIAEKTGARYFRATDTESLRNIYNEIDELEKTKIQEKGYIEYKELFHLFLIPGLVLLLLEVVLKHTVLRQIP
jgi:Ca-activated chloride channel family protein